MPPAPLPSRRAVVARWIATFALPAFTQGIAGASGAGGDAVKVAVAANFAAPAQRIANAFEQATGHRATLAIGSTGRFHAQIRNAAPFHVLLSADSETPARLESEGLAVAGSRFTYATGRLVLWSADANGVDAQGDMLRQGRIARLAVADPRLSPYGAATFQAMARLGVLESLRPRLVRGESIGQAWQFAASGNAQAGFVALAQVWEGGRIARGSAWLVPADLHAPLRQDAALLAPGRQHAGARAFLDFLKGPQARAIIRDHGYEL